MTTNQDVMLSIREAAAKRNEDLKKQAADRLRKNAEYNKANKPSKTKKQKE
jgi:hypothetical protein